MKKVNRWVILAASCLINLCIGSVYAWSVFASPMAEYLSQTTGVALTAADLAIVFTVANLLGPITMISGGRINDTLGPKMVLLAGGIMFGAGLLLAGFAKSVGMLILGYGIISGLGLGFAYGCTISNSVKFFPDKRGLIGGITTACYGLSSVILPPIATALIGAFGISNTFKILGIAFGMIVCGASLFVKKCPENYQPDGWNPPQQAAGVAAVDKDWREMLKSPIFYVMIAILVCGAFCGLMCTSQAAPIAQNMIGMTGAAAATAVSVLALFNAAGRIAAGHISDRIGRIHTISLACIVAILGLMCLYFSGEQTYVKFYIGISLVGMAFGAFMGVFPGFTADRFGTKNNSVNYGIMFIGFAAAGYFGPAAMKKIYNTSGSYQQAFLVAAAIGAVGFVLTFLYRALAKNNK